jgi:hypothetical protein
MLLILRIAVLAMICVPWCAHSQQTSTPKSEISQPRGINRDVMRERLKKLMQSSSKSEPSKKEDIAPASKETGVSDAAGDPMMPAAPTPPPESFDPTTRQKYQTALQAYYDYRYRGYTIREQAFAWQSLSSKIIFFSVLFLVLAGIYFAAVQFHRSLRVKETGAAAPEVTELDASLKGIKVSSPVLGVIILAISLAFFYLYLQFVYPIQAIY